MVYRKKNYKKRKRSGYKGYRRRHRIRRNARKGNRLVWKPSMHNPLPQEYITKVRLRAQGYFLPSAGTPPTLFNNNGGYFNNIIFMNNLYQPLAQFQTASIAHINGLNWQTDPNCQPIGHQTLCNSTTYRSYQVLASKFKWTMLPGTNTDRMDVVVCPNPVGAGFAAPTNITDALAVPWNKMVQANVGETTRTASLYVDMAKYLGVDKKVFRNDPQGQWSGTYSSAPAAQMTFSVVAQLTNHSLPLTAVGFIIEQQFYVRYYNLANNLLL